MTTPEPPAAPPAPETCFHHHDRETGRHCTRCGRPACGECLHQAAVGSQCWECIRAARPPTKERVRRSLAGRPIIATQILIGANVVAFLLSNGSNTARTNAQINRFEQSTYAIAHGEWWRLATSGFIHYGIGHIAFNLLALYVIGNSLERGVGPWRFSAIYFASLLAGSLGAMLLKPDAASAGASGAVFGIGAAATVIMARRGVRFWDTGFGPLLAINLVFDLFLTNVSIGGHIGGAIGGGLIGFAMIETTKTRYGPVLGYLAAAAVGIASFAIAIAYAHAHVTY